MKLFSLKIKPGMLLPTLCFMSLLSSTLSLTRPRAVHPSCFATNDNFSPTDQKFIVECLKEIERLALIIDKQVNEFFDRSNSRSYSQHIQGLNALIEELDRNIIRPLHYLINNHEVFATAYELAIELKASLIRVHTVLRNNQSSNHLLLAKALRDLGQELTAQGRISNLENKLNHLVALLEAAQLCNTSQLKNLIIIRCNRHPVKSKGALELLGCLKHRLGCR